MHRSTIATTKIARLTGRILALAASTAVIGLMIMGCGSHTTFAPTQGGTQTKAATFVGADACKACHDGTADHTGIFTEYKTMNPHGQNFRNAHNTNFITANGGACQACHVTGYGTPSGFKKDGSTPQLEGISCEECHGAGSLHIANPSKTNINRTPDAKETCWNCHVSAYKLVQTNPGASTDATFRSKAPGSVAAHHPQTTFLLGTQGYNRANEPGPHAYIDNTCVACHANTTEVDGRIKHDDKFLWGNSATCASCHGNAGTLKEEFQKEITASLIELGGESTTAPGTPDASAAGGLLAAYATAHNINLKTNTTPDDPAVKAFKGARFNYTYVLADASLGVHNPGYAERLLQDAKALLSQAGD